MATDDPSDLIDADEEMADALAAVLDHAEGGDGTVSWRAIRGEVAPEQWGRLVETGTLIDVDGTFVIDDPVAVEAALEARRTGEADAPGAAEDPAADGWSTYDKAAGVCSLALMSGYYLPEVRNAVGPAVDLVLGPAEALLPFSALLLLLSLTTGVASSVIQTKLLDRGRMDRYKERMTDVQARLKRARERGDDDAVDALQSEQMDLMADQFGMVKSQFRPMVWSMLVSVPVFLWLTWLLLSPPHALASTTVFVPLLGNVAWTAKVVGPVQLWLVWYMVGTLSFGTVSRKVLRGRLAA